VTWLLVALGAAVGAPTRFLVDSALTARFGSRLPWGTLAVNLSGSAVFGLLAGIDLVDGVSAAWLSLVGVGFCGSLTTASTFAWETVAMAEDGYPARAVGNLVLSVVLGLGLAAAGLAIGLST
jgi:fluoride exporter